jgi:hypothetical protein
VSVAVDPVEVEQELRRHVAKVSRGPVPDLQFWGPDAVVEDFEVERLDQPHGCQTAALEAARRFGFEVVAGWVAVQVGEDSGFVAHMWNLRDDGALIDAARGRIPATGYLGARLSREEVGAMSWAVVKEDELRERIGGFGRALGGLFG